MCDSPNLSGWQQALSDLAVFSQQTPQKNSMFWVDVPVPRLITGQDPSEILQYI